MKKTAAKSAQANLSSEAASRKPDVCNNCNSKIMGKAHHVKVKDGGIADLCNRCYENINKAISTQSKDINYPLAITYGLAFGIVGALIWFGAVVITQWQIGLVAIAVGWLAGFG